MVPIYSPENKKAPSQEGTKFKGNFIFIIIQKQRKHGITRYKIDNDIGRNEAAKLIWKE